MKVLITAPRGKMGKCLVKAASERSDMEILAGLGIKGREYIGQDIGNVAAVGREIGAPVVGALEAVTLKSEGKPIIEACDMIIDFSTTELSMEVLAMAQKYRKSIICGTTGFSFFQMERFHQAALEIPVLCAANTSSMVHLMKQAIAFTAKNLKGKVDIDIIEMHNSTKVDSPSGTAKEIEEVINRESGMSIRPGGIHSLRTGDVPSSHTVIFGGQGERIEIIHHAHNWDCYAVGACEAAGFLFGKEPGLYTMEDVIQQQQQ